MRTVPEPDLVGNALCLDFANTVNKRPDPDRDSLDTVAGLMRWAQAAGLETDPRPVRETTAAPAAARDLREAIYRVFSAIAADGGPVTADLATITAAYADAMPAARLR